MHISENFNLTEGVGCDTGRSSIYSLSKNRTTKLEYFQSSARRFGKLDGPRRGPQTGSALYMGRSSRPRLPAVVVTGPEAGVGRGVARRIILHRWQFSTDTTRLLDDDRSRRSKDPFLLISGPRRGGQTTRTDGKTGPARRDTGKTSRRAGVREGA